MLDGGARFLVQLHDLRHAEIGRIFLRLNRRRLDPLQFLRPDARVHRADANVLALGAGLDRLLAGFKDLVRRDGARDSARYPADEFAGSATHRARSLLRSEILLLFAPDRANGPDLVGLPCPDLRRLRLGPLRRIGREPLRLGVIAPRVGDLFDIGPGRLEFRQRLNESIRRPRPRHALGDGLGVGLHILQSLADRPRRLGDIIDGGDGNRRTQIAHQSAPSNRRASASSARNSSHGMAMISAMLHPATRRTRIR